MCVSGVPLRTHAVPHISNFTRLARFAGKGKFYSAITKRTENPLYRLWLSDGLKLLELKYKLYALLVPLAVEDQ